MISLLWWFPLFTSPKCSKTSEQFLEVSQNSNVLGFVFTCSYTLLFARAALIVREDDLDQIMDIVTNVHPARVRSMLKQVQHFWENYFSSMRAITLTTLQILNDRVFPSAAKKYEDWNDPPNAVSIPHAASDRCILVHQLVTF